MSALPFLCYYVSEVPTYYVQDYNLECPRCNEVLNDGVNCTMWYQGSAMVADGIPLSGLYCYSNCVKEFQRASGIGLYKKKANPYG